MKIEIDYDKCSACEKCVQACNNNVLISLDDKPVVSSPNDCAYCLRCEKECPEDALTHEKVK